MKETNLQKVVKMINEAKASGQSKQDVITAIVEKLGKSRSNAFVYFTKASKLVDGVPAAAKGEKPKKAVKPNSSEAFIQRVLEERKQANPFSGLGV